MSNQGRGWFGSMVLAAALLGASAPALAEPQQGIIIKYRGALAQEARAGEIDQRVLYGPAARAGVGFYRQRRLLNGAAVMRFQGRHLQARELRQTIAEIAADPDVEYAEEDVLLQPLFTPNDARYNEQWSYFDPVAGIHLPAAWDQANGTGVVVAVVDTGHRAHVDLAANLYAGYDFISNALVSNDGGTRDGDARDNGDAVSAGECGNGNPASSSSWHGTHVAGTIAALTNNSVGVAGIAYRAKILPVRVLGKCGGYTSDIADGIAWASGASVYNVPANTTPAKVINLSLGGSGACSSTLQNAINTARSRGAVVVVAAGNSSTDAASSNPANCTGVVVVAATDRNGGRAYYSNHGSVVDLAAPGGAQAYSNDPNGILSTLNSGATTPGSDSYALYQGTSMATPHVSGVAALMLSVNSALGPDQLETLLKSSARSFPASCSQCGSGLLDAAAAVMAAAGGSVPSSGGGGSGGGSSNSGGSCAAGYTAYGGNLAKAASVYLPSKSGAAVGTGTQLAQLSMDATGNFDLFLHKVVAGTWKQVAAATAGGYGGSEQLSYIGTAGTYRLQVIASKGSGNYLACVKNP